MKWILPPPLSLGWKMKSLESAATRINTLPNGSYELIIDHDVIKGVTPKMLEWWFKNLNGDVVFEGKKYNKYLLWHPLDHICWQLSKKNKEGRIGAGSKFRIVEAFGRNLNNLVDSVCTVTKLDRTGIKLVKRICGTRFFQCSINF